MCMQCSVEHTDDYHRSSQQPCQLHHIIVYFNGRRLLDGHAGSAIKVLVAIHYSVLDARNGYIRNVVV